MENVYSVLVALATWTQSTLKKARLAQEFGEILAALRWSA